MMGKYIDKDLLVERLKENDNYKELLIEILEGKFDSVDYEELCRMYIGKEILDFYCNGFFGRQYDLEWAIIKNFTKDDDGDIKLEVKKRNGEYDYAYFEGGWNDWKAIYGLLRDWTKENEEEF